jgi:hypothetical protein
MHPRLESALTMAFMVAVILISATIDSWPIGG